MKQYLESTEMLRLIKKKLNLKYDLFYTDDSDIVFSNPLKTEPTNITKFNDQTFVFGFKYIKYGYWDATKIDELAEKVYKSLCEKLGKDYVDSVYRKQKPEFTGSYAKYAEELEMNRLGPEPLFYCSRYRMSYGSNFKYADICTAISSSADKYIGFIIDKGINKIWFLNDNKEVILISGEVNGITDIDRLSEYSGIPKNTIYNILYHTDEMEPFEEFVKHVKN